MTHGNAYAERFVRTIKESCLERMILFGEGAVRKATAEFIAHDHPERNHPGLEKALICPDPGPAVIQGAQCIDANVSAGPRMRRGAMSSNEGCSPSRACSS